MSPGKPQRMITIYHIVDHKTPLDLYFPTLKEAQEAAKEMQTADWIPKIRAETIELNRRGICHALTNIPQIT